MANAVKWGTPASASTLVSTGMDSLGNNTLSALGTEYDNGTNKYMYCDVELYLGSLTPTAGGAVMVYIAQAPDGTNYADAKRESAGQLLCSFSLDTGTTAKRQTIRNLMLPPSKFKLYVDNQAGVSLASSGNLVKMYPYNPEVQ